MGDFPPNLLLRPGRFRIEMVLNAQLFRRCLIIAEQLNVLVMGSATSTPSSRRGQWQQWRRTRHRQSTSFLLQLLKACAGQAPHGQPDADRNKQRRKQPLLGSSVCPSGDNGRALNIATAGATPGSMYEPNQFVMNCGVVDPSAGPSGCPLLSLATSTTATRSLSPHPSYSRWGGYYSLSCCSLCNHPQLNLQ